MGLHQKFLAPEVVQSSALDCGPAALKCLLEGFGRHVSYGRLREACQTGIDGTSIDAIESVANQLGLEAEQIMLPLDHLFLAEAEALPAILVVNLPGGLTHFVVVWRRHGPFLQVMDPATGRRWVRLSEFFSDVYQHTITVAAADWREFAASDGFQRPLRARMRALGFARPEIESMISRALADPGWRGLAALDAAVRLAANLKNAGDLHKSQDCMRLVSRSCENPESIPAESWSVRAQPGTHEPEQLFMTGAVLVRVRGLRPQIDASELQADLAAAITDPPARPARSWLASAWQDRGLFIFLPLMAGLTAVASVSLEALLFLCLLGIGFRAFGSIGAVLLLAAVALLLEFPAIAGALRLGRRMELRYRMAFLEKLPKLADRYFHSRLISDMAERSHLVHRLRNIAPLTYQLLRTGFEALATAAALIWLEPSTAPIIALIFAASFLPLLLIQPVLAERDLRLRTHTGGLMRFHLDAMLGLIAVRAHSAEQNMRREHGKLLQEWARAAGGVYSALAATEAIQLLLAFALIAKLILAHVPGPRLLLIAYWSLNLPALAQEFGLAARQLPQLRNLTLRLLEPLSAPEENRGARTPACRVETHLDAWPIDTLTSAPAITFQNVSVEISGRKVLEELDFSIEPGEHVAIIGQSGAGKSSIAALLLGWLQPSQGEVLVNGRPLDCEQLRLHTASVDPAVQLWNRSLLANLTYGSEPDASIIAQAVDTARLRRLLAKLSQGFATPLGEGGGLLSGGEAQRVRFARALTRTNVQLVILDEPFRGLDRSQRHKLLARAREIWCGCTLLCITHDIAETQDFDRVLVIDGGRIIEQGSPAELRARRGSHYARLLESEMQIRALWSAGFWRRIRVDSGRVSEPPGVPAVDEAQVELT